MQYTLINPRHFRAHKWSSFTIPSTRPDRVMCALLREQCVYHIRQFDAKQRKHCTSEVRVLTNVHTRIKHKTQSTIHSAAGFSTRCAAVDSIYNLTGTSSHRIAHRYRACAPCAELSTHKAAPHTTVHFNQRTHKTRDPASV